MVNGEVVMRMVFDTVYHSISIIHFVQVGYNFCQSNNKPTSYQPE
jgi:hypothetical protein